MNNFVLCIASLTRRDHNIWDTSLQIVVIEEFLILIKHLQYIGVYPLSTSMVLLVLEIHGLDLFARNLVILGSKEPLK